MGLFGGRFRWWIYSTCFILLFYLTGETESAARFLSHVPQDDSYVPETMERDLPDYDADIKIPGRHYPKLPYQVPYLENEEQDFNDMQDQYGHHQSLYQNSHNLHHHNTNHHKEGHQHHTNEGQHHHQQQQHQHQHQHQHHQTSPVLAYGARTEEPNGATFHRESHLNKDYYDSEEPPADYLDDTQDIPAVSSSSSDHSHGHKGYHRLGHPKMAFPSAATPAPDGPSFHRDAPRSITVQAGRTAKLVCKVKGIDNKSVSWMRHEDLHILTVDEYRYTTDKRLSVIFSEVDQEWILQIQSVRQEDQGLYECQISTRPVLSFIVGLHVIESLPSTTPFPKLSDAEDPGPRPKDVLEVPSARIINGEEIYISRGSLLNLTCVVDHTVEKPTYIYWYFFDKLIDYESEKRDVVKVKDAGSNIVSSLLVRDASEIHTGKYTCRPSNGENASISVHVLNGEHQAAMQTNTSDRIMTSLSSVFGAISVGISLVVVLCRC